MSAPYVGVILSLGYLLVAPQIAPAQVASGGKFRERFRESLEAAGAQPIDPQPGHTYNVFMSTPSVPITFNRLEKRDDGDYSIGPVIGLGLGYTFILGKGTWQEDGQVRIDPGLIFGVAADVGATTEDGEVKGGLSGGLLVGFDKVAFTLGRDFIRETWFVGISARIDVFSFASDAVIFHNVWGNP